jgi:hypothetical protein
LINSIEHFEDLSSNEFIVTIDKETNLVGFAMFGYGHVDIRYCGHLLFIGNQDYFICQVFILFEEMFD